MSISVIIGTFTPLPDSIIAEHGLVTAAVFGRIWRYCEMSKHNCHAKIATLADELDLDRGTIMRHIRTLVENGYLVDHTPLLRNHPLHSPNGVRIHS